MLRLVLRTASIPSKHEGVEVSHFTEGRRETGVEGLFGARCCEVYINVLR